MQIIDGRKIRDEILSDLKDRVAALPFVPVFCDILVGNDSASAQYVAVKEKTAEGLGINAHRASFPSEISTDELIEEIKKISAMPNMSGLIIQLPLPKSIDEKKVLNSIPEAIDVDALGEKSEKNFYANTPTFVLPTAAAIMTVLDAQNIDLKRKNVVVVGQGVLVGKPVTHLLRQKGIEVSVIDSQTENKDKILGQADVVITAVGQAGLIKGPQLKQGVIIIDAGTSESNGAIAGDVDYDSLGEIAYAISPVPGGVGPVTVAMLMQNVVLAAEQKAKS